MENTNGLARMVEAFKDANIIYDLVPINEDEEYGDQVSVKMGETILTTPANIHATEVVFVFDINNKFRVCEVVHN